MRGGETALDQLADRLGIESSYLDARFQRVTASAESKRRLLQAMGFPVSDEAEATVALAELERAEWGRPLPPVQVVRVEDGAPAIAVTLPAGSPAVDWELTLEDGTVREGQADFSALEQHGQVTLDAAVIERRRLVLPEDLPLGYHRLRIGAAEASLIVAPSRCWLPPGQVGVDRYWGVTTQLYLTRSAANWGIGDFSDLANLARLLGPRGAAVIGLNPLHAMFPDRPEDASPYSPESRLLLNVLYIDPTAAPGYADCAPVQALVTAPAFQARLADCRASELVDYTEVSALKLQVLTLLFAAGGPACRTGLDAFREGRSTAFARSCVFEALRAHFAAIDPARADWQSWPEEYADPESPAVAAFVTEHAEQVTFRAWLQFLADTQLAAAAAAAREAGMAIGLYRDLAVGAGRGGAETWSSHRAVVAGAEVGAPPDIFNPAGQGWGLPPFHPRALREEGYRSFIDLVRANMRHAGGLRIDHVMGLLHLYWVPDGSTPKDGAYVAYALDDLVGILALESQRHCCLVVGEDLGTVPLGFRARMQDAGILSYRVLFFEQDKQGNYFLPYGYPALSLSVAGSHDMATLRGWWDSSDIRLKNSLGLYPAEDEEQRQLQLRDQDRAAVLTALREAGVIADDTALNGGPDEATMITAVHAFLAQTRSMLAMAQIDDITDEPEQVNVPATSHQHPNWRRKISIDLDDLAGKSRLDAICALFRAVRGPHSLDTRTDP